MLAHTHACTHTLNHTHTQSFFPSFCYHKNDHATLKVQENLKQRSYGSDLQLSTENPLRNIGMMGLRPVVLKTSGILFFKIGCSGINNVILKFGKWHVPGNRTSVLPTTTRLLTFSVVVSSVERVIWHDIVAFVRRTVSMWVTKVNEKCQEQ